MAATEKDRHQVALSEQNLKVVPIFTRFAFLTTYRLLGIIRQVSFNPSDT